MKNKYPYIDKMKNHLNCSQSAFNYKDYYVEDWAEVFPGRLWVRRLNSKIYSSEYMGPFSIIANVDGHYLAAYIDEPDQIKCCTLEAAMIYVDTLAIRKGYKVTNPFKRA